MYLAESTSILLVDLGKSFDIGGSHYSTYVLGTCYNFRF